MTKYYMIFNRPNFVMKVSSCFAILIGPSVTQLKSKYKVFFFKFQYEIEVIMNTIYLLDERRRSS